jgi:hypothetical protein
VQGTRRPALLPPIDKKKYTPGHTGGIYMLDMKATTPEPFFLFI